MSRFWGSPRQDDASDVESEREALRRQRLEAAEQLERLKRELAQRVAGVQAKERELEEQLAQGGRVATEPPAGAPPMAHDERAAELDALGEQLRAREAAVSERELAVVTRESELEAPEAAAVLPAAAAEPTPEPSPDELARIEAKLAELHEAEKQFARTHAELAARSDALAEREAGSPCVSSRCLRARLPSHRSWASSRRASADSSAPRADRHDADVLERPAGARAARRPPRRVAERAFTLIPPGALAQLGEHQLCKLGVAGSSPARSTSRKPR